MNHLFLIEFHELESMKHHRLPTFGIISKIKYERYHKSYRMIQELSTFHYFFIPQFAHNVSPVSS